MVNKCITTVEQAAKLMQKKQANDNGREAS
jgi:hypothetical protein